MSRQSNQSHSSLVRQQLGDWWLLIALLAFTAVSAGWAAWGHRVPQPASALPVTYTSAGDAEPAFEIIDRPIQDIRVGERVVGINPNRDEGDHSLPEPDAETWRLLRLAMEKSDGNRLSIELLRPLDWLAARGAAVGRIIDLDLHELGAVGPAEVLAVEPCPPIQPGPWQVVTGRFAHGSSHQILNLQIEGEEKPIGVTDNHPIWSETRQQFVEAGKLEIGEELQTLHGTTKITSIMPRGPPELVYNLEVHGEHVYHVAASGVLVHNACPWEVGPANQLRARSRGDKLDVHHTVQSHPARQVIPGYDRATGPAITVPEVPHGGLAKTRGIYEGTARDLLARDIKELRRIGAPRDSLRRLIDLNKESYPGVFDK